MAPVFPCAICSKLFATKGSRDSHLMVHSNVRDYPCLFCTKKFSRANDLRTHVRIHTGERPFGCDICGARFSQSGSRNTHRSKHMPGMELDCSMCNLSFKSTSAIMEHRAQMHRASHEEAVRYPPAAQSFDFTCGLCGKQLKYRAGLQSHMTNHILRRKSSC